MKVILVFLKKYWLHIVVAIVVVIAASYAYRKWKNYQNRKSANADNTQFDPIVAAKKLHSAMEGWGTNEEMIWAVLDGATGVQLAAVYNAYQTEYGKDLFDDFADELSGDEYARAMAYFASVQLT
jgi:hypothetical protein